LQEQYPAHERAAWFQRSVVQTYLEQGDIENVKKEVEKLKTGYSSHPDYINQMTETAERLRRKSMYAMAGDMYEYLLNKYPECSKASVVKRMQIQNSLDLGKSDFAKSQVDGYFAKYSTQVDFVQQAHELGGEFMNRKDYDTASKIYNALAKQFPDHPRAVWFQRSIFQNYLEMGKQSEADAVVKSIMSRYSSHPDYYNQIGLIAQKYRVVAKDYAAGQALYRHLLERFPNHPDAYRVQAVIVKTCLEQGDMAGADTEMQTLLSRYSGPKVFLEAADLIWIYRSRMKDYGKALELYLRLLKDYPQHEKAIEIHRIVIAIYLEMNAKEMADTRVKAFQALYAVDARLSNSLNTIATSYRDHRHYNDAIGLHEAVLAMNPGQSEKRRAYTGIAQCKVRLGEDAEVQKILDLLFTDYLKEDRVDYSLYVIGEEYYFMGLENINLPSQSMEMRQLYSKATAIWQDIISQLPDTDHAAHSFYSIGMIHSDLKEYEKAIPCYTQLIQKWPHYYKTPDAIRGCGRCYRELYKQGNLSVEDTPILSGLVDALAAQGDISEVPELCFAVGQSKYKAEQWKDASKYLGFYLKAQMTGRINSEVYYMLALVYEKLGDKEKSIGCYQNYIDKASPKDNEEHWLEAQAKVAQTIS
jgi:tetratricopeptide (TPR) repeat protein